MRTPTPRHMRPPRGFSTLIGNGWLRQPPPPASFEARSRSALRKCMFMQVPPEILALAPPPNVSPAALPPRAPRAPEPPIEVRRRDPAKDVRMFPAYQPKQPKQATPGAAARPRRAWWEDPVAIGSLLILAPPIGLAAVWRSKHYSNDARWALTVMTALTMCLMSAVTIAILALR